MKNKWFLGYFFIVFMVGFMCHAIYANNFVSFTNALPTAYKTLENNDVYPSTTQSESILIRFFSGDNERNSPKDRIGEDQIHVYDDEIVIDIKNATWSSFVNTNSMDPMFDTGANGIEIPPKSKYDIKVGDVISYEYGDSVIAHRVLKIEEDNKGLYYVTKGDNNVIKDPVKVRYSQVRGVLVGLIY
ncbi:signal peptidase I [Candidatus Woesearchaeota archaeon]|nr:signal peptidase I [Candidatus Woesearchaeota archaeon]